MSSGLSKMAPAPMFQAEIFRRIQEQQMGSHRAQLHSIAEENGKES